MLSIVVSSYLILSYLSSYTSYLFVYTEASVHWFYFEKSEENSCGGFSFLIKLQTPAHVLSCEFCEINNIYFVEKLRTATPKHIFAA